MEELPMEKVSKKKGKEEKPDVRGKFSGRIGYVLAVAGSAVGLGNIWRFPYLAAKYGGGMFLLVYLILMLTFGYVMIMSETTLGRMTKKSPVGAFGTFGKKKFLKFGGWINAVIPMLIVPYYSVIGGWVLKYLFEYLRGNSETLAKDGYFTEFITSSGKVEFWFFVFAVLVFAVILAGVKNGVERVSRVMMPMMMTVVAAMGQMFYSLSIAMGILYTYGSYIGKEVDIEKSTTQVEVFDTGVALLAGLMIIPSVFAFSGGDMETLQAGPSLTFITLPKVFSSMGVGTVVGIVFFLMFLFAALTSAISLLETSVSTLEDELHWKRWKCCLLMAGVMLVIGTASSMGYGVWDSVRILGMQFLDFFDFLTNSVMMPIAALATCLLIVRVVGFEKMDKEIELSSAFKRKKLYHFFLKYLAPLCILVILISSIANVFGWISM